MRIDMREGAVAPTDALALLVLNKSAVALPILEKEIEEILHSASTKELFDSPSADPQKVVNTAAAMIEYAGDEQSLLAASKLMKIDAHRFGGMVYVTLLHAGTLRNPFTVAYRGFEIGDSEVDEKIVDWAGQWLKLGEDYDHVRAMRSWAEAMLEKYDGVPNGAQWTEDPIASRLGPAKYPGLHDKMLPFMIEAAQKRSKQ